MGPGRRSAPSAQHAESRRLAGGFFQEAMVVNHPSPEVPFTRIVEYKHVPNQPTAVKDGKVNRCAVRCASLPRLSPLVTVIRPRLLPSCRAAGGRFPDRARVLVRRGRPLLPGAQPGQQRAVRAVRRAHRAAAGRRSARAAFLLVGRVWVERRACRPRALSTARRYRALAEKESGVCFVGRLASYKYFNMDQAILNALEIYDNLKETGKLAPKRSPADFGPGDGPK